MIAIPKVSFWTRFAVGKGTEELHLQFEDIDNFMVDECRYELPQRLFTNPSFKALCFCLCSVVPKGVVAWNSLTKLSISYVELSDAVIRKILAGSPVLEFLEIYCFYGFDCMRVSHSALKELILREIWDFESYRVGSELEISAPNLQSLQILGCLGRTTCRLLDVLSLVDATLNFKLIRPGEDSEDDSDLDPEDGYESIQNFLRGLLESLVHVKNITLGTWAIQVGLFTVLSLFNGAIHRGFLVCSR